MNKQSKSSRKMAKDAKKKWGKTPLEMAKDGAKARKARTGSWLDLAAETKAIHAKTPGWRKLSSETVDGLRRLAVDVAKTVEELAEQSRTRDLPQLVFVSERELPPQVEMAFESSDADFARLLGLAMLDIPAKDQANLLVGEFIRRALVEFVKHAPPLPQQRCGNCEWFERDDGPQGREGWGCCRDAVERARKVVPAAIGVRGCVHLHESNDRARGDIRGECPCHRYKVEDKSE